MEQLINKLEAKIDWLTKQLESAHNEIKQLKGNSSPLIEDSASMDLLKHMPGRSNEDQIQLYIEESLDLLKTTPPKLETTKAKTADTQLSFDLLHEHADSSAPTTNIEQIINMTIQQPEQNNDELNTEDSNMALETNSGNTEQEQATTLTPEQKKRQKNQKNNRRLIKLLEDRYPKAFDWNQPNPLKVGIDKDMVLDDEFNESKQKRALAAYTRSDRYKKCLTSGQPRIDLEGIAVNNEPALPESMMPKKAKTFTSNRPKTDKETQTTKPKRKPQAKTKPVNSTPKRQNTTDSTYDNLSPEERMKAKLEKLLNKS